MLYNSLKTVVLDANNSIGGELIPQIVKREIFMAVFHSSKSCVKRS